MKSFLIRSRPAFCQLLLVCLLAACASLPEIGPVAPDLQPDLRQRCRQAFPAGPHQFVHAVEARLPDDSRTLAVGIVTLDPDRDVLSCVIMTIEGFVLFDARQQRTLRVNRAVHPFDSEEFAQRMLADIRLIFFQPRGRLAAEGVFGGGFAGCRWLGPEGTAVDMLLNPPEGWMIRQYDVSDSLTRRVRVTALNPEGFPGRIELSRLTYPRYTLRMTLIRAERLPEGDERLK